MSSDSRHSPTQCETMTEAQSIVSEIFRLEENMKEENSQDPETIKRLSHLALRLAREWTIRDHGDEEFHREVAAEIGGGPFTSCTGNLYVDALRTLKKEVANLREAEKGSAQTAFRDGFLEGQAAMRGRAERAAERAEKARKARAWQEACREVRLQVSFLEVM